MTPGVSVFGETARGKTVHRAVISNHHLTAAILTYGCTLQDLRLDGTPHSLTIGSTGIAAYETALRYCGAIVGPVANRIGGARATIDGRIHQFDANEIHRNTLHGGTYGTHAMLWTITDTGPSHACLSLDLPDGWQGFPGNRTLTARYELTGATLRLTLGATTDAPTLMNLANHSYWRLGDAPTTAGQTLRIAADRYLPTSDDLLPTGQIAPVAGTRFDYRKGRALNAGKDGPLDTNFCLSDQPRPLQWAAELTGRTGLAMTLATTAPGLQVYDGHSLSLPDASGQDGAPYGAYAGLALEPQFWPDAPHNPGFPDITLRPDTRWQQVTTWSFTR